MNEALARNLQIFLSVIVVVRNQADDVEAMLTEVCRHVAALAGDFEIVVVDNASEDASVSRLKALTAPDALPNLQVFALTKEVDPDTAAWVGLENALGDFVLVLDPALDSIAFAPTMLEHGLRGMDVVFAANTSRPAQSVLYRFCAATFARLYRYFNGIDLATEAPPYRLVSRRVVNFLLQHRVPALTYRHLPATAGFPRVNLTYDWTPQRRVHKKLGRTIDRGTRLLVSSPRGPLRLVTSLCLFGAVSNVVYSAYVIAIALFKHDVQPGWITLSLQQSGMFFLLSLVLLVLGEYVLQMAALSNEGPSYHIGQEFTSATMTMRRKLNVEAAGDLPEITARTAARADHV